MGNPRPRYKIGTWGTRLRESADMGRSPSRLRVKALDTYKGGRNPRAGRLEGGATGKAGGGGAFLGYAFGMAIEAFDEVNVVGALCGGERCVHLFDIEAAIGEARMAGGAGRARVLAVFLMTR